MTHTVLYNVLKDFAANQIVCIYNSKDLSRLLRAQLLKPIQKSTVSETLFKS